MIRSGSTDGHSSLDRRRLTLGLLAAGLSAGWACGVSADPGDVPDPVPTPGLPEGLQSNLFTRLSVGARVNGSEPYEFVIDTGATRTAVSLELAAALGLPEGPNALVHGVTSAETARTVRMDRLDVAGRRFNDIQPCVFPRAVLGADGLLGLDALSGFRLDLDVARRVVSLTPSGPDKVTFGRLVPSRLNGIEFARSRKGRFGQLILMNARAEGVTIGCFVDSGAQYSIGNPALRDIVAERQGRLTALNPIRVFGVTGQMLEATPATISQLEINRMRLGPTPLLFADLHAFGVLGLDDGPALLIGADVINRFSRVSLDFGLSRMDFGQLRRPALRA